MPTSTSSISRRLDKLDCKAFSDYMKETYGIEIGDDRFYVVSDRLQPVMEQAQLNSATELIERIRGGDKGLRDQVIDTITINETSWFRDQHPFTYIKENLLTTISPDKQGEFRIWSAACSYGPEPYSISILMQEYIQRNRKTFPSKIKIVGTDVSARAIEKARSGLYTRIEMSRGLTEYYQKKYFLPTENGHCVEDVIKKNVHFHTMNLLDDCTTILGKFDIIFCRNVLIYFHPDKKKKLLEKLANSLLPNGYLLLGASDFLLEAQHLFKTINYKDGAVYQLLD